MDVNDLQVCGNTVRPRTGIFLMHAPLLVLVGLALFQVLLVLVGLDATEDQGRRPDELPGGKQDRRDFIDHIFGVAALSSILVYDVADGNLAVFLEVDLRRPLDIDVDGGSTTARNHEGQKKRPNRFGRVKFRADFYPGDAFHGILLDCRFQDRLRGQNLPAADQTWFMENKAGTDLYPRL
ncbi:hypothetical protein ES707_13190 [subsurface metagenome]